MKNSSVLLVFFLGGIIFTAGCTAPISPDDPEPEVPPPANPVAPDGVTSSPLPVPTPTGTFWPGRTLVGEIATVPTTRIASDNPHLDYLTVRKRTFTNPLPDCLMENAFPSIAKDPEYGIQQVVPKLAAVSEEEYETFLRKYTEGKAENTGLKTPVLCQNTENEPTWNFIEVRAVLIPTNFFPSNYTITENVRSNGEIVAQFVTTERLVIDQQLVLARYVPLHADEVDLFDNVDVTYTRH